MWRYRCGDIECQSHFMSASSFFFFICTCTCFTIQFFLLWFPFFQSYHVYLLLLLFFLCSLFHNFHFLCFYIFLLPLFIIDTFYLFLSSFLLHTLFYFFLSSFSFFFSYCHILPLFYQHCAVQSYGLLEDCEEARMGESELHLHRWEAERRIELRRGEERRGSEIVW